MHKLTEEEFRQFVKKTVSDLHPPENFRGSEQMIGKVLHEEKLTQWMADFMMRMLIMAGPHAAACSVWATGFQIGREFEAGRIEVAELNRMIPPDPEPPPSKSKTKRRNPGQ